MNILMVIADYYPGPEGGAERQCRKLVHALSKIGHTCCVLTSCHRFGCARITKDAGSKVFRVGRLWPVFSLLEVACRKLLLGCCIRNERALHAILFWALLPIRWLARLAFLIELRSVIHRLQPRPDVIHVHESGWLAGVGIWLGKILRVPVVCKVRNTPALDVIGYDVPFRKRWEKLRRAARFIALHDQLRVELLDAGIDSSRISVIPNGVELPHFSVGGENPCEVLYVGNFSQGSAHKGFDILIRAWGSVSAANPDARLIMVGGGNYDRWVALAQACGCADSVCFLGPVRDIASFYQRACLFVLPSRREGMSNALLEAQSYGLPAVVSDIPANRAVVCDGVNGVLFQTEDCDMLAKQILRLLSDIDLREKMGAAARIRMEQAFSMETVCARLISFYKKTGHLTHEDSTFLL